MGLPGHRRTSSHKRRRAAHFALRKDVLTTCQKCQQPVAPHRACKNCGTYRGRTILDTGRDTARVLKKTQAKKAPKQDHDHDHEGHTHEEEAPKA